jgi:hypothetical protein
MDVSYRRSLQSSKAVLGIRNHRILIFLDLPDPEPDPLVRGTGILPFSHKGELERTEIMLAKC